MGIELWLSVFAFFMALAALIKATEPRREPEPTPEPEIPDPKPEYLAPGVLFIPADMDLTVVVGGKLTRVSTRNDNPTIIYENK